MMSTLFCGYTTTSANWYYESLYYVATIEIFRAGVCQILALSLNTIQGV